MRVIVLDDGIRGNLVQALGIAERLPAETELLRVRLRGPEYTLPGRKGSYAMASKIAAFLLRAHLRGWALRLLKLALADRAVTAGPRGDVVISAGSYLAPVNVLCAAMRRAMSVCIMTPEGTPLESFDLLIVPAHDLTRYPALRRKKNVLATTGSPNRITQDVLKRGAAELARALPHAATEKVAAGILVGGNDQNYEISAEWAEKLLAALTHVSRRSGAVYLLTTSRRTSAETRRRLDERTAANPAFLYREFPGITPNSHYLGILGLSSVLLVTEDSINMVSESCSSGRPVVVLGVGRRKKRLVFDETIARLEADGCCTYLPAEQMEQLPAVIERARARTPHILNEAERCTREILRMLTQNAS